MALSEVLLKGGAVAVMAPDNGLVRPPLAVDAR